MTDSDRGGAPQASEKANVLWFLPTHGDGRYLGTTLGARDVTLDYLTQVAKAADDCGYYGVLLPTGRSCEDSWIIASALVPLTKRLRYLVAVRPGLQSPAVAARMTSTLDRISNGRLLINVVTGGDPVENAGDGIFLSHDERYAVTDEFLRIYTRLLAGETFDYDGKHLQVKGSKLLFPPVQHPHPPLYFGGSSPAGQDVAAKTVQKYLTWGEPPASVAEKIAHMRRLAAGQGRELSFGIRLHVIVRETNEEAWREAAKLIEHVDDATIAEAQKAFARMDSCGAKPHGGAARRPPRQARGQPEPVGRRRPRARRCRHGARRRPRHGRRADARIHGRRHRYVHHVGIPAPGRSLPLRRAGAAAPAARRGHDRAARRHDASRAVRRDDRQHQVRAGHGRERQAGRRLVNGKVDPMLTRRDAALRLAGITLATGLPSSSRAATQTLRVGVQKYGTLLLLKASGLLEKRLEPLGWRVEWRQFISGPPLMEALGAGAIDIGAAGDTPPIFAQAAGVPLVYLATEPLAPKGEAILVAADSPIKTLADLKGRKVAFNKGSNVHCLYIRALEKAGLQPGDVTPVYLAPPDGRAAFARGSVDAWVIWDPFLAAAQAALPTRTLVDGTGLAGNRQFYLGNKHFTEKPVLDAVQAAIADMDRQVVTDPAKAAGVLAPSIGLPEPVVAIAVGRQTWAVQPVDQAIAAEQQAIADVFYKLGLIPKAIKISDALLGA